ncbi:zinc ribbon domain-containing protein [Leptotrichia sp. oral taxon 847]|uniref:zinc ribbon domain-containing protein n=1 Tax=Leptotrichia sp. oral taxon 847 TaxID=1785996 RepID=UPI00076802C2|nr:zinc ribbon domain-containing protein [Leptotrichia sp. oral taxon 847]AMD94615.1 hypothetical protein AXF11_02720 [Leptotrichia sp. oral taxon 847]
MRNDEKCLKCGEKTFEIKKIAIPTTKIAKAKIGIDTFYLKICQNCGYTEMYSTKVIEKVKDPIKNY